MALSEDQKAMLRLLAQRGEQGYEDLSALMGIGVDEVHAKASEAAAQLESEGIPAPVIPPPPGSSAAKSPAPAKPAPEPKPQAQEPPPAAPAAPEPAVAKPAPKRPKRTPPPRPKISLPGGGGGAKAAIVAGVAVLALLIVVLIVGGGDDSDSSGGAPSSEISTSKTAANSAAADSELTKAILSPVDGGDAEGLAVFGRVKKNVVLQVQAEGLDPSPKGSSYIIWLYKSPQLALRVGSVKVTESGGIAAQLPIPTELLAYVAGGAFDQVDISLASDAAYKAELAKSKQQKRLPAYTGEDVLRGPITGPAIKAANETRE
ncbi:MAG TPA: hypothetical protein VFI03_01580 [Solirubrobacterales bacterium]|nr:hypothetical protein [Solirubrobacterales bacterium]